MDNIIGKYEKTIQDIEKSKDSKGDEKSLKTYINHMDQIKKKMKSDY